MPGYLQLDDLLRGLTGEAQKDSSGVFTMDSATALEKLSKFQMASPHQYCLRWLQAGVAGGAKYFNWNSSPTLVTAELGDFVLPPARISHLPTLLLDPAASRSEQHLSAGLNAALRTRARCVRLRSGNYQGVWKPGDFHIEYKEMGLSGTKIELERHVGLWRQLFPHSSSTLRDDEQELLHRQGTCAPLSLGIQGCTPDRRIWQLKELYGLQLRTDSSLAAPQGKGFRPPPFNPSRHYPERCSVFVVKRPGWTPQPALFFPVKDGVLLEPREPFGRVYDHVVFADVSDLTTDLTGLQLVEDQAYKDLILNLRQYLR